MTTRTYSTLFACLYDQTEPVGSLGRGTHYSIMQATQWRDDLGNPTDHPKIHEFAVVWDEDHDERVISVIERLHLAGLMWPVVFIGERKGGLSLLIGTGPDLIGAANDDYKQRVQTICNDVNGDVWNCEFGLFDNSLQDTDNRTYAAGIINDRDNKVLAFLRGVSVLWRLGIQNHSVQSLYSN
jgi:hypothetical protein